MVLRFIPLEEDGLSGGHLRKADYPLQAQTVFTGLRKYIFTKCPTTGRPVSTGLKAESVIFESLPAVAVPLCCPACGKTHNWKPAQAWIGTADRTPLG
jgi:endogenous inhibitor of DNA gyrase (YacG/DUF329 family)